MAVNKIVMNTENGAETLIDLTADTVAPENLAEGETAHDASGNIITGLAKNITITQEAGESESLVMSQKAVTNLVAEAIGTGGGGTSTEYETVDSVEEMTDTSKQYVLSTTGTIWAYGEVTVEKEAENKLVPSTATLNQRLSGSSGSVSANSSSLGSFVTDFIAVSDMANISPYDVRLNWEMPFSGDNKIVYFNSNKMRLGNTVFSSSSAPDENTTISNGETVIDIKTMGSTSTSAPSNWADVAYIRLQLFVKPIGTSLTSDDVANLTITFDHEGGTTTENQWYDTELTPSASGGGGGNYVELLVKINKNTSDISEVSKRVTVLETGSDTVTIPTFWQNAVDACISKIKALQVGRNCVTFPFFSDNHQNTKYAGVLIAHIMKECHIPYCFFGGDSISNGIIADEATMIAQDEAFDTMMSYVPNGRMCRAVGNHDGYWYDGTNKYYYSRDQVYDLFLREESIAQNKHFGDDGTYYYVDDIASKIRFIVLNTNGVDSTQLSWLQNTALSISEGGWAVVFISHHPICNAYHSGITNAADIISAVTSTATTHNIPIVGWFSGHVHRDRIYTNLLTGGNSSNAGTPSTDLGFTQVIITSDHTGIAYDNDDGTTSATKHTPANDDQSHAIDFVTINKSTRTVNITRLGIGSDRSYSY